MFNFLFIFNPCRKGEGRSFYSPLTLEAEQKQSANCFTAFSNKEVVMK